MTAVVVLGGCAARQPRRSHAPSPTATEQAPASAGPESLSEYMQKLRHLSANVRPLTKQEAAETLESRDPAIAAELLLVAGEPTAERHRSLAETYRERGVLDAAYRHFKRAIALNPRDAAAYEGLARVWRDWGLPHLGLGDAHRAIYNAPRSASARNTLGTLLHALGLRDAARESYSTAIELDREAAYAFNNLCYLSFVEGKASQAIAECQSALRVDPALAAARNNLALTYAAIGRLDLARREFAAAGGATTAAYNMGVVYLAERRFSAAADEFEAARAAQPRLVDADRRARNARRLAELDRHAGGG